jgi:hypothetical protein
MSILVINMSISVINMSISVINMSIPANMSILVINMRAGDKHECFNMSISVFHMKKQIVFGFKSNGIFVY